MPTSDETLARIEGSGRSECAAWLACLLLGGFVACALQPIYLIVAIWLSPSLALAVLTWPCFAARFQWVERSRTSLSLGTASVIASLFSVPMLLVFIQRKLLEPSALSRSLVFVITGTGVSWGRFAGIIAIVSGAAWILLTLPRVAVPYLRPGAFTRTSPGRWSQRIGLVVLPVGALGITVLQLTVFQISMRNKAVLEPRLILSGIRTSQQVYFKEYGTFVPMAPVPRGVPSSAKRLWPECPESIQWGEAPGYCFTGYYPEGPTYCSYSVTVNEAGTAYTAEAICDLDNDGELMVWGVIVPAPGETEGIPGSWGRCSLGHAISDEHRILANRVTRCSPQSGVTEF